MGVYVEGAMGVYVEGAMGVHATHRTCTNTNVYNSNEIIYMDMLSCSTHLWVERYPSMTPIRE